MLTFVLLSTTLPVALQAQAWEQFDYEDLSFRGIGVEGGRIWPDGIEPAPYFGLRVDLGFVGPRVRVVPSARFWSSGLNDAEVSRLSDQIILVCERQVTQACPEELDLGEVKLSDLELSLDAQRVFLPDGPVSPFLGFSLGLHLLNGRGDFIDGTFVEDLLDTIAPGIGPLLGVHFQLGNAIRIGTEARFMLATDVRYASFGGTAVWTLPTPRPDPVEPVDGGL